VSPADDAKALVRRFYEETWNNGQLDVVDELFAPDYVRHDLRAGVAASGPQGQKDIATAFRAAFPDLRFVVDFVLAEGDLVAARWTANGTNTGSWGGIEPTGKQVSFSAINVFRFAEGKVVELWNHRDDLGLMEQLGVPVHAGSAE
jgi:steroid delta-isomerase-like uncharacterized protein